MIVSLQGHSLNFVMKQRPLLFYQNNIDWFRTEPFAGVAHYGDFDTEEACPAAVHAYAYVKAFDHGGKILYAAKFVDTSDKDREGQIVYVGRVGQYGGFQIHRHLKASA